MKKKTPRDKKETGIISNKDFLTFVKERTNVLDPQKFKEMPGNGFFSFNKIYKISFHNKKHQFEEGDLCVPYYDGFFPSANSMIKGVAVFNNDWESTFLGEGRNTFAMFGDVKNTSKTIYICGDAITASVVAYCSGCPAFSASCDKEIASIYCSIKNQFKAVDVVIAAANDNNGLVARNEIKCDFSFTVPHNAGTTFYDLYFEKGRKAVAETLIQNKKSHCANYVASLNIGSRINRFYESEEGKKLKPVKKLLIEIGGLFELFHDDGLTPYALVNKRAVEIYSSAFTEILSHCYYILTEDGANKTAITDAKAALAAKAKYGSLEHKVYTRVAYVGNTVYLDLANAAREMVKITASGWEIINDVPVRFYLPNGQLPLPVPEKEGADYNLLFKSVHVTEKHLQRLLRGASICHLLNDQIPIVCFMGPSGSGKSSAALFMRNVLDPHRKESQKEPKEEQELLPLLKGTYTLNMDNTSTLNADMSDSFCRLQTNGQLAVRKLYTESDQVIYKGKNPLLFTGIAQFIKRPDLSSRTFYIEMSEFKKGERRLDLLIKKNFKQNHPKILGGLCNLACNALKNMDNNNLKEHDNADSRLAGAIYTIESAESGFLGEEEEFRHLVYQQSEREQATLIESSSCMSALVAYMERKEDETATGACWLQRLKEFCEKRSLDSRNFPKTPTGFANLLRGFGQSLRAVGLHYANVRTAGERKWRIYRHTPNNITEGGQPEDAALNEKPLNETPAEQKPQASFPFEIITQKDQLQDFITKINHSKTFVLDTETTGLDVEKDDLVGIALAVNETACYIPILHTENTPQLSLDTILKCLADTLNNPNITMICHNIKFDMAVLEKVGFVVKNKLIDTMLYAYLYKSNEPTYKLDSLVKQYLDYEMLPFKDLLIKTNATNISQAPIKETSFYASEDAFYTMKLFNFYYAELLPEQKKIADKIDVPLVFCIGEMEKNGFLIDKNKLKQLSEENEKQCNLLAKQIHDQAGKEFNINSSKQLGVILYEDLKLKCADKTETGNPSTGEATLKKLIEKHPIIKLILEYKKRTKLKTTYFKKYPAFITDKSRIHTTLRQTKTNTGRLTSEKPNLQQVPKELRTLFIAPEDHKILAADYSQMELRILAHYSKDASLIQAFENGYDVHRQTASKIFNVPLDDVTDEQRKVAKTVNFGLSYGMSAHGLKEQLNITKTKAETIINDYFKAFPKIKDYIKQTIQLAKQYGYVKTAIGRRIQIQHATSLDFKKQKGAENQAINAPIQGTAADIARLAMLNCHKAIQEGVLPAKMLLQVHDELVFEVLEKDVENAKRVIIGYMEQALKLAVPLVVNVGVGDNWATAHK